MVFSLKTSLTQRIFISDYPGKAPAKAESIKKSCANYPAVAETTQVLGYVRDKNGVGYSRDIGRSSMFSGRCYYVFGDTFCKNAEGLYVGISSNTIAVVPDPSTPLDTEYQDIYRDGMVKTFIPLTEEEDRLKDIGTRVVLWPFGGIVEASPGLGWIWYQKIAIDGNSEQYNGVGIARVNVEEPSGQLNTYRCLGLIFDTHEPRVGTFSSLIEGEHIYLWGESDRGIILARVSKLFPTSRNAYRYWDGQAWVEDWREGIHVMKDMQHGSFFKSTLFGSQRPWVFVGCTSYGDSMVMLGAEASLEGPWTLTPLIQATGITIRDQFRYCMYGHALALNAQKGELLVTWSEQWPGGVIGAKIKLSMGDSASAQKTSGCGCLVM